MNITEATYATHLHEWLLYQPELCETYIHAKALGRGKELPFGRWTACFRCLVEAS